MRDLFSAARSEAPSLIFFDEFDALAGRRSGASHSAVESIVATLLSELDGLEARGDVFVVAATNRPDAIDPAVRRPGRLGKAIAVPDPDEPARRKIFSVHLNGLPTATDVTANWAAGIVPEGITGVDINGIVERAFHTAIGDVTDSQERKTTPVIEQTHFVTAVDAVVNQNSDCGREYR